MHKMETNCDQKCHDKDCYSIIYNPIVYLTTNSSEPKTGLTIPSTPTISATSKSAVSLILFLTDVSSALGFWLGISAFGLFDRLKKIVNSVLHARKKITHITVQIQLEEFSSENNMLNLNRRLRMTTKRPTEDFQVSQVRRILNRRMAHVEY